MGALSFATRRRDLAAKRHRAMAQIADLLPQLQALMKAAGTEPALKAVA